jgi:uncharacterized repeat protein (TIGR01451 family)
MTMRALAVAWKSRAAARRRGARRAPDLRFRPGHEIFEDRVLPSSFFQQTNGMNGTVNGADIKGTLNNDPNSLMTSAGLSATIPSVSVTPSGTFITFPFSLSSTATKPVTVGVAVYTYSSTLPDNGADITSEVPLVPGQPTLASITLQPGQSQSITLPYGCTLQYDAYIEQVGTSGQSGSQGPFIAPLMFPSNANDFASPPSAAGFNTANTTNLPVVSGVLGTLTSFGLTTFMTNCLDLTKTADSPTVTVGNQAGYTITLLVTGGPAANVSLNDPLPAGGGINWMVTSSGTSTNWTPATPSISGSPGSQALTFSSPSLPVGLYTVHIAGTTTTTTGGVGGSANPALGILAQYAVLFDSGKGNQLSIANDTVAGNIGVYGPGSVQFSGPGTINGRVDFSAANTGQFHNTNGSNVGPTSVNYNVAAVTTARNLEVSLSSSLGGLTGTNLAIGSGNQTVNESDGTLQTSGGVTYRVFNVTSYAMTAGHNLTIVGDGSGDPVLFNVAYSSNSNINGGVILAGTGLSDDLVMWNFTSSGKNINMAANKGTFVGVMLLPNDAFTGSSVNIDGRIFGGANGNMQIVSGTNVFAPPSLPPGLINTATVTSTTPNQMTSATATITITPGTPQLAAGSSSTAGAGLTELLDPPGSLQAGPITVAVNLPQAQQSPAVQEAIASAVASLNAQVAPLGLQLVQVSGATAETAQVQIGFASNSSIGGAGQGIMGAFTGSGQITLINGWNWYFGANPSGIGSNQYDFQSVLSHELGHVLGLGENSDPASAMDLYLGAGQVRRDLTPTDLSAIQQELGASTSPLLLTGAGSSSVAAPLGDVVATAAAAGLVLTAPAGPALAGVAGTTAAVADLEVAAATAGANTAALRPVIVPGLSATEDHEESQAGPTVLVSGPAAASPGVVVAAVTAAGAPVVVLAGPATVTQGAGTPAQATLRPDWATVLPGSETGGATGVAHGNLALALAIAESLAVPVDSIAPNGMRVDAGARLPHAGLGEPAVNHDMVAIALAGSLPSYTAPASADTLPDAVDAALDQVGSDGASEEADASAVTPSNRTAAVAIGLLALGWNVHQHLGRQRTDRRQSRPGLRRRLAGSEGQA